jgi:hypothetical protein
MSSVKNRPLLHRGITAIQVLAGLALVVVAIGGWVLGSFELPQPHSDHAPVAVVTRAGRPAGALPSAAAVLVVDGDAGAAAAKLESSLSDWRQKADRARIPLVAWVRGGGVVDAADLGRVDVLADLVVVSPEVSLTHRVKGVVDGRAGATKVLAEFLSKRLRVALNHTPIRVRNLALVQAWVDARARAAWWTVTGALIAGVLFIGSIVLGVTRRWWWPPAIVGAASIAAAAAASADGLRPALVAEVAAIVACLGIAVLPRRARAAAVSVPSSSTSPDVRPTLPPPRRAPVPRPLTAAVAAHDEPRHGASGVATRRPALQLVSYVPAEPWEGAREVDIVGEPPTPFTVQLGRDTGIPDCVIDGGRIQDVEVRAASCRGASHQWDGGPRQDAYAVASFEGRFLLIAVADGVSNAMASHVGSAAAAGAALDAMRDQLRIVMVADLIAGAVMGSAATAVRRHARAVPKLDALDEEDRDAQVATTLTAVAIDLDSNTMWWAAVGDSPAYLLVAGRWLALHSKSATGTIAHSATRALPLGATHSIEGVLSVPERSLVVVASDGLGDTLGAGTGEVGEYLASSWDTPPNPLEFARTLRFARKSFDDDRTAVAAWFSEAGGAT